MSAPVLVFASASAEQVGNAPLTANDITIAVTVFDRRDYIFQSIESALSQTLPIRVLVVEDHGPDELLQRVVVEHFGDRITYHRNAERLGLCGNWNSCLEVCPTSWLCILHDDDFLEPTFVESMIELAQAAPSRALYYGRCHVIDEQGRRIEDRSSTEPFSWHELPLEEWARYDPVCFPAQLFDVRIARNVGGFRSSSKYTADWEMWFKLALTRGAAATDRVVANYREYHSHGRGTTAMEVSGQKYAVGNIQRKRHYAWLSKLNPQVRFNRHEVFKSTPMSTRFLLQHAHGFSARMLRYNAGLLNISAAPSPAYRFFQVLTKLLSWRSLQIFSRLYRLIGHRL